MKQVIPIMLIALLMASCQDKTQKTETGGAGIVGTWELVSGTTIVDTDTVVTDYTKGQKMIKIINATHFAFLRHDLNKGKDSSAIFVAGGGSYTLSGDEYTENLDFCNDRNWEGHRIPFKVLISQDSLVQTGHEKIEAAKVDRIIIEKYVRAK